MQDKHILETKREDKATKGQGKTRQDKTKRNTTRHAQGKLATTRQPLAKHDKINERLVLGEEISITKPKQKPLCAQKAGFFVQSKHCTCIISRFKNIIVLSQDKKSMFMNKY